MGINFTDYFHLAKVKRRVEDYQQDIQPGNSLIMIIATEGTESTE